MAALRVLIVDLPDLQADVVAGLVMAEPDMVVVGERAEQPMARLRELSPDVILVSPRSGTDDVMRMARVGSSTGTGILAIDVARGSIVSLVDVPDEVPWPAKLIAAIRSAAPPRTSRHRQDPAPHGHSASPCHRR